MNGKIQIALGLSMIAMFCILMAQVFWLNGAFELKKEAYQNQINKILVNVIETGFEEYVLKDQQSSGFGVNMDKKQVYFMKGGKIQEMTLESEYGYTALIREICYDLVSDKVDQNLEILDSICGSFLKHQGITEKYVLELIDTKKGAVLATTERVSVKTEKRITSNMIKLGLTSHHGLIAYFDVPSKTFYLKMAGVLVGSILLVLLLVFCFVYQFKTMIFQKNLSRMREDFMSNMVHELKSPLVGMQTGIDSVEAFGIENLTDYQRSMLGEMRDRTAYLNNFVYKLLIVWKKGFEMSWKKLNLRKTIDVLVKQFGSDFTGKAVTIEIDYQLDVDIVEADELHFPNAISNLIENAIKYSGDAPKIEILCKQEGAMLVVSVKDNGVGIPEKYKDKIFERYYRVNQGQSSGVHGFGIGLSYVKQVVEAHEGVIRVESELGVGTKFTIMIPLVTD